MNLSTLSGTESASLHRGSCAVLQQALLAQSCRVILALYRLTLSSATPLPGNLGASRPETTALYRLDYLEAAAQHENAQQSNIANQSCSACAAPAVAHFATNMASTNSTAAAADPFSLANTSLVPPSMLTSFATTTIQVLSIGRVNKKAYESDERSGGGGGLIRSNTKEEAVMIGNRHDDDDDDQFLLLHSESEAREYLRTAPKYALLTAAHLLRCRSCFASQRQKERDGREGVANYFTLDTIGEPTSSSPHVSPSTQRLRAMVERLLVGQPAWCATALVYISEFVLAKWNGEGGLADLLRRAVQLPTDDQQEHVVRAARRGHADSRGTRWSGQRVVVVSDLLLQVFPELSYICDASSLSTHHAISLGCPHRWFREDLPRWLLDISLEEHAVIWRDTMLLTRALRKWRERRGFQMLERLVAESEGSTVRQTAMHTSKKAREPQQLFRMDESGGASMLMTMATQSVSSISGVSSARARSAASSTERHAVVNAELRSNNSEAGNEETARREQGDIAARLFFVHEMPTAAELASTVPRPPDEGEKKNVQHEDVRNSPLIHATHGSSIEARQQDRSPPHHQGSAVIATAPGSPAFTDAATAAATTASSPSSCSAAMQENKNSGEASASYVLQDLVDADGVVFTPVKAAAPRKDVTSVVPAMANTGATSASSVARSNGPVVDVVAAYEGMLYEHLEEGTAEEMATPADTVVKADELELACIVLADGTYKLRTLQAAFFQWRNKRYYHRLTFRYLHRLLDEHAMRNCFITWKLRARERHAARKHQFEEAYCESFIQSHEDARTVALLRRWRELAMTRQLRVHTIGARAFAQWRAECQYAQHFTNSKVGRHPGVHRGTVSAGTGSSGIAGATRGLLLEIFTRWKRRRDMQRAEYFYRRLLSARTFFHMQQQSSQRSTMRAAAATHAAQVTLNAFNRWHHAQSLCVAARAVAEEAFRRQKAHAFHRWCTRWHARALQMSGGDAMVDRDKARVLRKAFFTWRRRAITEQMVQECLTRKHDVLLAESFARWNARGASRRRKRADTLELADHAYIHMIQRVALRTWHHTTQRRHQEREVLEVDAAHSKANGFYCLSASAKLFYRWRAKTLLVSRRNIDARRAVPLARGWPSRGQLAWEAVQDAKREHTPPAIVAATYSVAQPPAQEECAACIDDVKNLNDGGDDDVMPAQHSQRRQSNERRQTYLKRNRASEGDAKLSRRTSIQSEAQKPWRQPAKKKKSSAAAPLSGPLSSHDRAQSNNNNNGGGTSDAAPLTPPDRFLEEDEEGPGKENEWVNKRMDVSLVSRKATSALPLDKDQMRATHWGLAPRPTPVAGPLHAELTLIRAQAQRRADKERNHKSQLRSGPILTQKAPTNDKIRRSAAHIGDDFIYPTRIPGYPSIDDGLNVSHEATGVVYDNHSQQGGGSPPMSLAFSRDNVTTMLWGQPCGRSTAEPANMGWDGEEELPTPIRPSKAVLSSLSFEVPF